MKKFIAFFLSLSAGISAIHSENPHNSDSTPSVPSNCKEILAIQVKDIEKMSTANAPSRILSEK